MRASVILRILLTPLIWFVFLFILGFVIAAVWPAAIVFLTEDPAFGFGGTLGLLALLFSLLTRKGRADHRYDFDRVYGSFGISNSSSASRAALLRYADIVEDYEKVWRTITGKQLVPLSTLPHSKEEIKQAIRLILALNPGLEANSESFLFMMAYRDLARFIPDDVLEKVNAGMDALHGRSADKTYMQLAIDVLDKEAKEQEELFQEATTYVDELINQRNLNEPDA
jgi:hypothetical protein